MATHSRGSNIKRVEVVWPVEFVERLDKEAGGRGSRAAFMRDAVEKALPKGKGSAKQKQKPKPKPSRAPDREAVAQAPLPPRPVEARQGVRGSLLRPEAAAGGLTDAARAATLLRLQRQAKLNKARDGR